MNQKDDITKGQNLQWVRIGDSVLAEGEGPYLLVGINFPRQTAKTGDEFEIRFMVQRDDGMRTKIPAKDCQIVNSSPLRKEISYAKGDLDYEYLCWPSFDPKGVYVAQFIKDHIQQINLMLSPEALN